MKIFIHGLNACVRRNYDVQRYKNFLKSEGHEIVNSAKESELVLIWSCAFRKDVRDKSLEVIKLYQQNYNGTLVVCGCLPSIDEKSLNSIFNGYYFSWKDGIKKLEHIVGEFSKDYDEIPRIISENVLMEDDKWIGEGPHPDNISYHDRFKKLVISEGCLGKCTYCAEKLAFPAYNSFSVEKILSECKQLITSNGLNRIMIFADDVGDYGIDLNKTLPDLLKKILEVNDNIVLGLQCISPRRFIKYEKELIDLIEKKKIFHVCLPIQSANNRILKLMKRESDIEKINEIITKFDYSSIEFETHIIIGFPSETQEEFEETINFITSHRFKWVGISGYAETNVMESFKIPDKVSAEEISNRVKYAIKEIEKAGILYNYEDPKNLDCFNPKFN